MCLIVVGWRAHPEFPLVVAANRDEFYSRPSTFATRWPEVPEIIGGIDQEAGGTWLGITEHGRFAAVTNVREPGMRRSEQSRGKLTRDFLISKTPALDYARQIDNHAYAGFNLLLGDGDSLVYCSNRDGQPRELPPGIYGLSNHVLDSPWPKLLKARESFARALPHLPNEEDFFELLADGEIFPDERLPQTGVGLDRERMLSAVFVRSEDYGTRASTVVWQHRDGSIRVHERSFGSLGKALQSSVISTSV